jgi:addiction module RelE/StbE family toxin
MFICYSSQFKKRFNSAPRKIQDKINVRLNIFFVDEFSSSLNNHELHGEYSSCRSINITGDIRLIYKKVTPNSKEIHYLIDFGTHCQLYE